MKTGISVTKEEFMRIVNFIFLLFALLASCQSPKEKAKEEEKFSWNAGISAPKYYPSAPFVEYLYQGKSVAGASTGAGDGWGTTSGGFTTGNVFKPVPDSVFVRWECGVDHLLYKGGFKLPRKKILELFNKGFISPDGEKEEYTVLIAGTAPGGNVTIWMQAGSAITEIIKYKAENKGVYREGSKEHQKIMNEIYKSKEFINSETNIFHYFHGVPYKVWETGEKEYNYDIGFSSEDGLIKPQITTFYAKDGSWYQSWTEDNSISSIDNFKWDKYDFLENNNLIKKVKLPVQIELKWKLKNTDKMFHGILVMPNNLEQLMSKSYKDSITNKQEFYNRIVIGAYKGGDKGILWLTGKNKKTKLMEFIMLDSDDKSIQSYYSLPKNFVFPKWEKGKEPLTTPDVDYWQEK